MPDVHSLVNECVTKLKKRKVEGSKATAKLTAELLRSFISQQRLPHSNQAGSLIDAVKTVGEKLIAANPVELAVGNVVRRVLQIIREEDLSLTTAAVGGLSLAAESDDEDDTEHDDHPVLSATAVAAAARNALRPPHCRLSLRTYLTQ
ncbi:UNVERIFIED_CONTAM: Translation initiation factor eIF-2B subunit beta [Sesamum radiatum]|uniref:Translation initiation factor eIF2B subunit beta n=1 Tax=Sesamum radiatum TaxID=300843 RepID=A0AAW2V9F5_SESRA